MGNSTPNKKNIRSAPAATPSTSKLSNKLALGAGCYWGTEKYVRKDFQKKFPGAIKTVTVGFMSPLDKPRVAQPDYRQVCSGSSGHIEVLYVELNEPEKHFEELIRFFFQFHDPTTKNRQGNDSGFQYASWIFCDGDAQTAIAERVVAELQAVVEAGGIGAFANRSVSTKVSPLKEFTPAHAEHQEYLSKHPNGYCNHRIRFKQWLVATEEVQDQ